MTSAITNPLEPEIRQAILAADVLAGHDRNCSTWIRTYREPPGEDSRRRENRRRRG
jgi:5-methyltetrahydrofolate--homocysteine methyltransferase